MNHVFVINQKVEYVSGSGRNHTQRMSKRRINPNLSDFQDKTINPHWGNTTKILSLSELTPKQGQTNYKF